MNTLFVIGNLVGIPGVVVWACIHIAARRRHWMAVGYGYGERDGYVQGNGDADLMHAVAMQDEAAQMASVVSAFPGAYDSAAFWDAVASGALHDAVGEVTP